LDTKLETDVEHLFANLRSNINNFENPTRQRACKRRSDCSEQGISRKWRKNGAWIYSIIGLGLACCEKNNDANGVKTSKEIMMASFEMIREQIKWFFFSSFSSHLFQNSNQDLKFKIAALPQKRKKKRWSVKRALLRRIWIK